MDIPTVPGTWYTVASTTTCQITDTATGTPLGTADAGSYSFQAQGNLTTLSDDSALYSKSNFKSAPAALMALGLLGGGASTGSGSALPAGYLAIHGLQTQGNSYFDLGSGLIDSTLSHEFSGYLTGGIMMGTSYQNYDFLWAGFGVLVWGGNVCAIDSTLDFSIDAESKTVTCKGVVYEMPRTNFKSDLKTAIFGVGRANAINYISSSGSKFYYWRISKNGENLHEYIPVIDSAGVACVFDKVEKTTFYNGGSAQFVAILTLAQAQKLFTLPATGGSLTISLPTGYESDAGVMAALETARSNGWTLTVQTYEAEAAAASTFALRRIWVRRTADENGMYIDDDGTRWLVDWCVDILTPGGSTPDAHGYALFRSVDAAVEYWELTPYVDPEAQKLLTENTNNE